MINQTLHNRYTLAARIGKVGVNEWETNKRIPAATAIRLFVVKFVDGKSTAGRAPTDTKRIT